MCEPESYSQMAIEDSMPQEYVAKVVLYIYLGECLETPGESEVKAILKSRIKRHNFKISDFEIEKVEEV